MIQPNRPWSVNLSKESLLKEIEDEIQKEYQILNKFSSEKFSLILVIFGILSIFVTIWPFISPYIDKSHFILLYIISANLLFLFWSYWEYVKTILGFSHTQGIILPKISHNVFQLLESNERDQLKFFLSIDWVYAKKGEPHSWAFFLFLLTLIGISYTNFQSWINVPHLNDPIIGVPFSICLIIFSTFTIIANYYLNIKGILWDVFLSSLNNLKNKTRSKLKILFLAVLSIALGMLLLAWVFFFYIFPFLMLVFFVAPNIPILTNNLISNLLALLIFTFVLNGLVEFIAVPYGINLVENIKNEKIWWLETIKAEIQSFPTDPNNERDMLKQFYKKFDCSDIYIPIPIQRFFVFQKYVFLPKWIFKPIFDIDTCSETDFQIFKERFNFHKNLIYRNIPYQN